MRWCNLIYESMNLSVWITGEMITWIAKVLRTSIRAPLKHDHTKQHALVCWDTGVSHVFFEWKCEHRTFVGVSNWFFEVVFYLQAFRMSFRIIMWAPKGRRSGRVGRCFTEVFAMVSFCRRFVGVLCVVDKKSLRPPRSEVFQRGFRCCVFLQVFHRCL